MIALIQTKLAPPPQTTVCIERKPLLELLTQSQEKRLSVIAAPSGFGKSTLLAEWYARVAQHRAMRPKSFGAKSSTQFSAPWPIAWLSLDPQDNEPMRFFDYLTATIQRAAPEFRPALELRMLDAHGLDAAAEQFAAALTRLKQPLAIAIDDFQWLCDERIARALGFIMWRSPAHIRWVIAGRGLHGLPLSEFQLSDQLHVIDQRALSFGTDDIVQLCQKLRGVVLTQEQAEQLRVRTEGWVAGLKLTLLADQPVSAAAFEATARSPAPPHDVARYVDTAVLEGLDKDTREFVVVASLGDRFCAELCSAVLGITNAQSILDRLERKQLFVVPLDSEHRWYRYHTLFRDCLRTCLHRDYAAQLPALHLAASRWYAEQRLYREALSHAFAGGRRETVIQLLVDCAQALQKTGDIATVLQWTTKLTRDELLAHESIATAHIVCLIFCRRFAEASTVLDALDPTGSQQRTTTLRRMLSILSDTKSESDVAADMNDIGDDYLTGTLMTLQAYRDLRQHRFDAGRRHALRASELLQEQDCPYGVMHADMLVCIADRATGKLESVAQHCETLFERAEYNKHDAAWVTAATAMALLRYEQNRLKEAAALCVELLPLLARAATIENFTVAYVTTARIRAGTGESTAAIDTLDYLHGALESTRQANFLPHVCYEKIRLYLALGRHDNARNVATEFRLRELAAEGEWATTRPFDSNWERLGLSYAVLLLQAKQTAECRGVLKVLIYSAQQVGYVYRIAPLFAMLAACEWQAGHRQAAFEALNDGLGLMRNTGFTRAIFDEVPLVSEVLAAANISRQLRHPLPARYLEKFASFFPVAHPAGGAASSRHAIPMEQLTESEARVLMLLAEGLSNQEISERSQIALSTAKWHLKNVFAKLNVTTRTSALFKARELRLIE